MRNPSHRVVSDQKMRNLAKKHATLLKLLIPEFQDTDPTALASALYTILDDAIENNALDIAALQSTHHFLGFSIN